MINQRKLVLKGTTAYYEKLVPEVGEMLNSGGLVFVHDSLMVGCEYRCLKCFSDGSRAYIEQLQEKGILPENLNASLREKLIREAESLGAKSIVVPGAGEPLSSPDLDTIVSVSSELGMTLVVFTNGRLLDEDTAKEYFSKSVSIIFSLDSLCPETYNLLTGTKDYFEVVRRNLEDALKLAEEYSYVEGEYNVVPLAVNTNPTLLTYNPAKGIDEVREIHELIDGRATHFVSHLTPTGNARQHWSMLVGTRDHITNENLKEAERKYSTGLGGSSRRKDGRCAYIYNGVVHFVSYWMVCPNQGLSNDFGKYPSVGVGQHFEEKKTLLKRAGDPLCITRTT